MRQINFSRILVVIIILFKVTSGISQTINKRIDSLLDAELTKPFSGVVLIADKKDKIYQRVQGLADQNKAKSIKPNSQFIVGSISKQFTAVMVLREYDLGHLQLTDPVSKYLPEIKQAWADSVNIHHLLTHTHGIAALNEPLMFKPGSQYSYSQLGYELLGRIAEKTSGKSLAKLSEELFKKCKMRNSFHPEIRRYKNIVNGYSERDGKIVPDSNSFENYPAAGGFISTAGDLLLWNDCLHGGKLLKPQTYKAMITAQKNAVRNHPLFGNIPYGYGITVTDQQGLIQLGQTGFAPGFISMNFYFPATQTSLIVLGNIAYDTENLKKTFHLHTSILQLFKEDIKTRVNQ